MGVALSAGYSLEQKGNLAGNRFSGTEYFTSLDASTSVTVGTLVLTNTRVNPGVQGTLDIGTTTKPAAGINGNDITITSQPGSDYSGGLGPGLGGDSTLKGGTGGLGDASVVPSANGGDAYVEGGPPGANLGGGVGAKGKVNIGLSDTLSIVVGTDVLPSGSSLDIGSSASPFDYGYFNDVRMTGASGSDLLWVTNGGGDIGAAGPANAPANIYATTLMKVGASTALKSDRLSITGAAGDPGSQVAGDFWYNTTSKKLKYYDGTTAYELATSSAASNSTLVDLATATAASLTTALSNYSVVYVKGTSGSDMTADVTIPAGRWIVGVETALPEMKFDASHKLIVNGYLYNVQVTGAYSSRSQHVITTDGGGILEDVRAYTAGNLASATYYGVYGAFLRINNCQVYNLNGVYLTNYATYTRGNQSITNVYCNGTAGGFSTQGIYLGGTYCYAANLYATNYTTGITAAGSSSTYTNLNSYACKSGGVGVNLGCSYSHVFGVYSNSDVGSYGVAMSAYSMTVKDVVVVGCTGTGVYSGAMYECVVDGISVKNNTGVSIYFTGSGGTIYRSVFSNFTVYNGTNIGLLYNAIYECNLTNVRVYYCRGTNIDGIEFVVYGGAVSNIAVYDCSRYGMRINGCSQVSFSSLEAQANDNIGVYFVRGNCYSASSIMSYGNGGAGVYIDGTSCYAVEIGDISAAYNTGYGVQEAGNATDGCQICGLSGRSNTSGRDNVPGANWAISNNTGS